MFDLKPISKNAIPAALSKAERYRLLNEPAQAESICEDVLAVDPQDQQALVMLLLALSDQFSDLTRASTSGKAMATAGRLRSEYERAYYSGLVFERRARAQLQRGGPASLLALDWFEEAMRWFERAEAARPADNDDAVLRWNACVRTLRQQKHLLRRSEERDMTPTLE